MHINRLPNGNRPRRIRVLVLMILAVTGILSVATYAIRGRGIQANSKVKLSVQDPRPLAKAIETLESRNGWVITYEDPRYVNESEIADVTGSVRKDLDQFKAGEAPKVLIPKGGALSIEYDVDPTTNKPADSTLVVQQLLDAQSTSGNAGKFRLERNGEVIHVIPTAVKDTAGALTSQESVLDAVISIPAEDRTGMQLLDAICVSVSQATETRVVVGTIPLNLFVKRRTQRGAASQKARDVLATMLEDIKSGTNLSWQLFYDPGMKMYVLNIHQVRSSNAIS
jgi:hypothetical protein